MSTPVAELGASSSYKLEWLTTIAQLRERWTDEFRPLVKKAVDVHPGVPPEDAEDVLDKLLTGQYRMLTISRDEALMGIVIVNAINYPKYVSICMVYMAGSKLLSWSRKALAAVEDLARDVGAKRVESVSRPEIADLMRKRLGFKQRGFMTKDI